MWRSVLAIVVGFIVIALLAFGADGILRSAVPDAYDPTGRVTSVPILILSLAYVGIFAITGCYLAARLAPGNPMRHALILGALGLVFNIAGAAAMWDTAPAWYHATAIALVMPYAWIGGRIRERQLARGNYPGPAPLSA